MPKRPVRKPPQIAVAALIVILTALTFGVAGVLLGGSPPTAPGWPPVAPGPSATWQEVGLFVVVLLGLWLAYKVAQRLLGPTMNYPAGVVAMFLATAAAVTAFYVLLRIVGPLYGHPQPGSSPPPTCTGQSCPPILPPPPTTGTPTLWNPPMGPIWSLPWWMGYLLVGATAVALAIVFLPYVSRWLVPEDQEAESRRGGSQVAAHKALAATLSELEGRPGTDPRNAIVLLYGRLLQAVTRRFADIDPLTAREIERYCVEELGVRPTTARELTLVFEEARYSTRPLGRAEVDRARRALVLAIGDITRV